MQFRHIQTTLYRMHPTNGVLMAYTTAITLARNFSLIVGNSARPARFYKPRRSLSYHL